MLLKSYTYKVRRYKTTWRSNIVTPNMQRLDEQTGLVDKLNLYSKPDKRVNSFAKRVTHNS